MNVLVSSCFLLPTRYDGKVQDKGNILEVVECLKVANANIIPICPEQLGGLSTPRSPAEIIKDKVYNIEGKDVTMEFEKGAHCVLSLVESLNIDFVILKENSPSCGVHQVSDGNFTHTKISGQGITTRLLKEAGVKVYSEADLEEIKGLLCK